MNDIELYNESIFENIKHKDENGNEYWEARELQTVLEYSQWRRFNSVIEKAIISCKLSGINVLEHFANVGKVLKGANNSTKILDDYKLSR